VVVKGVLPNVSGFTVAEYSALPEVAREQLMGFAGIREALILAVRIPDLPEYSGDIEVNVVTDPRTGLSV